MIIHSAEKKICVVLIPALTTRGASPGDLLRKIDGRTLIQRSIDKAKELTKKSSAVYILTNSDEIALIGERNATTPVLLDNIENPADLLRAVQDSLQRFCQTSTVCIRISPYAPLLGPEKIRAGRHEMEQKDKEGILLESSPSPWPTKTRNSLSSSYLIFGMERPAPGCPNSSFSVFRFEDILRPVHNAERIYFFKGGDDALQIRTSQDWWVCEKLLKRRRLVFRVIGNDLVGMGHIYRALTLAHELTDHELFFVTDPESESAVRDLAGSSYTVKICDLASLVHSVCELKPDIVINDILDTQLNDVDLLQKAGAKVVNFEDLGTGARKADLVINELYDEPQIEGKNILWGRDYFFVRDEFAEARPNQSVEKVRGLLLTFGGVDQHNLSTKIYRKVRELCNERGIRIYIVTGPGFSPYRALRDEIRGDTNVELTHATGVISQIMEKVEIAISSNGRTVYELAHMSVPGIIVPQHAREKTHSFACEKNGFIQLEPYVEGVTELAVEQSLKTLLEDSSLRNKLFESTRHFCFDKNKSDVVSRLLNLLSE